MAKKADFVKVKTNFYIFFIAIWGNSNYNGFVL